VRDDLSGPDGIVDPRSTGALADRGLLTVSRRGSRWRAEITDSGRFYLEHGNHPDDPELAGSAVASERPRPKQKHPAPGSEPLHHQNQPIARLARGSGKSEQGAFG